MIEFFEALGEKFESVITVFMTFFVWGLIAYGFCRLVLTGFRFVVG